MPKRNVYFTDEQVAEMKKYPEENWSSVCQEAVGARLKFLDVRSAINSSAVERAKARLGDAKAAFEIAYGANARERGVRAGMSWAADKATLPELRNLHGACTGEHPNLENDDEGNMETDGDMHAIVTARAIAGVTGEQLHSPEVDTIDEEKTHELVHEVCPPTADYKNGAKYDDAQSGAFWAGFRCGALSIYEQI